MDYGIVAPGPDVVQDKVTHEYTVTHLFNLRSLFSILNVNRPKVSVLSALIDFINNDPSVTRPIGDVFVGAHSTAEGFVTMQMTVDQKLTSNNEFSADYETIGKAQLSGALVINDATIGPDPTKHFLHFKGCSIGRIPAFMQKWKLALGGKIQVTAPRFNHGVRTDQFQGVWEYMVYEFIVHSPTPLANRNALIQQYQNANFTFVETLVGQSLQPGPPVPPERWNDWLPAIDTETKTVNNQKVEAIVDKLYPQPQRFTVQQGGLPFSTIDVNEEFEATTTEFKKKLTVDPMPTTSSGRLAALQAFLAADPRFKPAHPFPIYQRYGYPDFPSFMSGWTWHFSNKPGSTTLYARGTRKEYSLFIGLTDPNPGRNPADSPIRANFHPLNPPTFPPINDLPVTDPRFFQTV